MPTENKAYTTEEVANILANASPAQLGKCVLVLSAGFMLAVSEGKFGFKYNNSLLQMASWVSMKKELSGKFIEIAREKCLENLNFLTHAFNAKLAKQPINYSLYERPAPSATVSIENLL